MSSFLGNSGGGGGSPASGSSYGTIKLAGDLSTPADAPRVIDLSMTGEQQGSVLYFNGTNWVQLSPGTSGSSLQTNGVGANPSWVKILNSGIATLDFGATPGSNYATIDITGQTDITSSASIRAFFNKNSTADHNEIEHEFLASEIALTTGDIVAGTGFTIYAYTSLRLTGTLKVNWEWR